MFVNIKCRETSVLNLYTFSVVPSTFYANFFFKCVFPFKYQSYWTLFETLPEFSDEETKENNQKRYFSISLSIDR